MGVLHPECGGCKSARVANRASAQPAQLHQSHTNSGSTIWKSWTVHSSENWQRWGRQLRQCGHPPCDKKARQPSQTVEICTKSPMSRTETVCRGHPEQKWVRVGDCNGQMHDAPTTGLAELKRKWFVAADRVWKPLSACWEDLDAACGVLTGYCGDSESGV